MRGNDAMRAKVGWWKLYLFVGDMTGIMLLMLWTGVPASSETLLAAGWAALVLAGISLWLRANSAALYAEELEAERRGMQQAQAAISPQAGRSLPLTPVQRTFLRSHEQQRGATEREASRS
jgi:hypothetical protein